MAKITVDRRLNKQTGEHELVNYRIEGEGLIGISYEFMEGADRRYVNQVGNIITVGPYRLEIVEQTETYYRCKVIDG